VLAAILLAAAATATDVRAAIAADRWEEALTSARELAAANPDDPDATAVLGEALYRAGRIDEAAAALAPLAGREGAPPRGIAQLGLAWAAQGKDADGAKLLRRAAQEAPEDPWILFNASGATETRAAAIAMLEAYIAKGPGEDPDRIESARGTIRLYRALGEREIWVGATRPDRVELPLKPLLGEGASRGWVLEATLARGKKVRLLLDSGSTGLFVVERAVAKGGLQPLSEETVFAGGGSGRTRSGRGILPSIAFGGLSFRDALVTTTTEEFDPQGRIHGVLGLSVFSGYRATLDLAKGRLVLEKTEAVADGAPYWSVSGQMLVTAGAAGGGDGLFLFDTGATRSSLGLSYAKRVPGAQIADAATVRTYGGTVAGATTIRGVRMRFAGLESRGDAVTGADMTQRSRLGGVEISGFLGLDLLDGKTIVVDTRQHRVAILAPAAR
jgi:predicted aspartyl protease